MYHVFSTDFGIDWFITEHCINQAAAYCDSCFVWLTEPSRANELNKLLSNDRVEAVLVDKKKRWNWTPGQLVPPGIVKAFVEAGLLQPTTLFIAHDDITLPTCAEFKAFLSDWEKSDATGMTFRTFFSWDNFETIRIDVVGGTEPHCWIFKWDTWKNLDAYFVPTGASVWESPWPVVHHKYLSKERHRVLNDDGRPWLRRPPTTIPYDPKMTWDQYKQLNPNARR